MIKVPDESKKCFYENLYSDPISLFSLKISTNFLFFSLFSIISWLGVLVQRFAFFSGEKINLSTGDFPVKHQI